MESKKIIYEIHPREYSVVGISSAMQEFLTADIKEYYGATLKEIILVVKDGQFYHIQIDGDRQRIDRSFLKKVENNKIDLEKENAEFLELIRQYEKLINQPERNYSLDTILNFYKYYRLLIRIVYTTFDTPDLVHLLSEEKRKPYFDWVTKIRLRSKSVYKDGEMKFLPKYLNWLSKNILPAYTPEELGCLFFKELENFVIKKSELPSKKELQERKKLFFIRQYPIDKYELLSGKAAEKEIKARHLFEEEKLKEVKELKGQIAYSGKIIGKARLILKRQDMPKFKKGEIVVSIMTDHSYLPIMKNAKAFVTDEGGVLCHAAIVARELKKPCIIGTKFATKVLRNGDLVEVDAGRGIVRILK